MKRFSALALMLLGSVTLYAQRGGGHAGARGVFSGGGAIFHSGFRVSPPAGRSRGSFSPNRAMSFQRLPVRRPQLFDGNAASGFVRGGSSQYQARQPYSRSSLPGRYRKVYVSRNGIWSSYLVPAYLGPAYLDYGDAGDSDSDSYQASSAAGNYPDASDANSLEGQAASSARDPYYAGAPAFSEPSPSPARAGEEAVTLVFKDGRPSAQIHNYALTRTMLYVLDEQADVPRDIPVSMIDLDATTKVNRDAGVDFQLPVALR